MLVKKDSINKNIFPFSTVLNIIRDFKLKWFLCDFWNIPKLRLRIFVKKFLNRSKVCFII